MKTLTNFLMIVAGLFLSALTTHAQFSVSGEFRPRFEYRDGYLKLRDSTKVGYPVIPGRNRLVFDYADKEFTSRFSIQQAYVFGENNYSSDTITKNTVNIYEAWFRYAISEKFAFKVGRMELIYDDGRLLGNSNWSTKAASHDAAVFQWEKKSGNYKGDFGFAINNAGAAPAYLEPYLIKNYKYMGYLYEQKKFLDNRLTVSLLGIVDVFQKASSTTTSTSLSYSTGYVVNTNKDTIGTFQVPVYTVTSTTIAYPDEYFGRFTAGGTVGFSHKDLKLSGSGYFQGGHLKDGRKVQAWFAGGYASYQFLKPLNFLVGYEYMSGNDYSKTSELKTKSKGFSTLYSTSHGFYGYMDLFSSSLAAGDGAGLTDLYGKATVKVNEKTNLEATCRIFSLPHGYLAKNAANPSTMSYLKVDKYLGTEIDLMAVYKPLKTFEINAAYCFFLPEKSMEIWSGLKPGSSRFAQYAYVMLTWKPTFFTTEKK